MKIGVAQIRPVKGNIQQNIERHKTLIDLAVLQGTATLIFPELSLTGYEPELAEELATTPNDSWFNEFQEISDRNQITLGLGMPIRSDSGILISMLIFQPHQPRQIYAKQYLHADEYPYFTNGNQPVFLDQNHTTIALAICYELSVPEHAEQAFKQGADVYMASVVKSVNGVEKAVERLAHIARTYSVTVLMANCVGYCDNFESAGKSAIWNNKGVLVGQLNNTSEGVLLIDTETGKLIELSIEEDKQRPER